MVNLGLGVLTLLVFTPEAGEEHCLTLVRAPQLDGGVAHLVMATLGALPLDHGTVGVLVNLLLLDNVVLTVEVDGVAHHLLAEELVGNNLAAVETGHVAFSFEAREESSTAGTEVNLRTELSEG